MTTLLSGREVLDDDVDLVRDRILVERAQAGDRRAFDDLYQRYSRRLYRFCLRRLHDPHEAEDVAQEAFARAWRALPNFAGDRRFYPWLSVIAAHLCTDVQRRRSRSTPVAEFHQQNVASTEDGGEELVLAAVDSEMVARAFQRLSDRHQRILSLREGSGWSYQRIADHEGVGITAVETLLWRARQALKREFASIAGSEGRVAALLGGLLSLVGIRRLLRLGGTAARRLAHPGSWASAAAVGTTVAATAAVVAAAIGGGSPLPTALASRTTAAAGAAATSTASSASGARTGGGGRGGAAAGGPDLPAPAPSAPAAPASSLLPGVGTTLGSGGLGAGGSAVSSAGSALTGVTATLNGATGVAGSTITRAGSSLSGVTNTVGSTVTSTGSSLGLSGVTSTVGSTVTSTGGALDGVTATAGATVNGLLPSAGIGATTTPTGSSATTGTAATSTTSSSTSSGSPASTTTSTAGGSLTCTLGTTVGSLLGTGSSTCP